VRTIVKNAISGLCIAASFLLISSTLRAQVLARSGDVAGYAGYLYTNNIIPGVSNNHGVYGATGGYNITPYITAYGEYGFAPLYSESGDTVHAQIYGGGARFNMTPDKKVVPYGVVSFGGNRLTVNIGGSSVNFNGYYIGVGGGANCYVGKNWGVRPEFRYLRNEFSSGGESVSFNDFAVTGGVFYQWGGTGKRKK